MKHLEPISKFIPQTQAESKRLQDAEDWALKEYLALSDMQEQRPLTNFEEYIFRRGFEFGLGASNDLKDMVGELRYWLASFWLSNEQEPRWQEKYGRDSEYRKKQAERVRNEHQQS